MRKPLSSYLRLIFLLGDLLIINGALTIGIYSLPISESIPLGSVLNLFLLFNGLWLFFAFFVNPYKFSRVSRAAKIIRIHFSFILLYLLAISSILFLFKQGLNLDYLLLIFLIMVAGFLVWRIAFIQLNRNLINRKLNYLNVVIVGFGPLALDIRRFFRIHPEHGYKFLGYFDQNRRGGDIFPIEELSAFCQENKVDEIYCCLPYLDSATVKKLTDYGLVNLIKVKLIIDYKGILGRGLTIQRYDEIPVLRVAAVPLDERYNQIIKRAFDLAFAGVVTVTILSWLIPLIALLIKLDSKGPVFFLQKRSGRGNLPFDCFKFRTMYVHGVEFKQATKDDPRITPLGRILRKTSLDELPQFINVLKGDMSIIGPRPHPLKLNEHFSPKIAKFMARHYVKPGITGLAQARGFRGETQTDLSMKGRIKLDLFYIDKWSFFLDVKIVFATVISLLKGDQKAY